ncbi:hypothetical protein EDC24_1312 [Aquisalibacillus elongatus]|uniref:DUF5667 domain-containing protein n=2 Tax=Aquisalibacillus elongatus TaxID=485577 RepID=A0A3N5B9P1_9BACI|nr:hypothetical protein EDC24_1312 [Aquisalibacillus elongatus]
MKKMISTVVLSAILLVGTLVAAAEDQSALSPDSEVYDFSRILEDAEYELTEEEAQKVLLQNQYADERITEAELVLEEGDSEKSQELLEDYEEHLNEISQVVAEMKENEKDSSEVEEVVAEKSVERNSELQDLLEKEDLPEEAKEGISQAIDNQEKAMENLAEAQEKAREAQEQAEEKQAEAQEQAEEKQAEAQEQAEEKQSGAQEKAEEKQSGAQEKAEEKQSGAQEKAEEKQTGAQEQAEEKQSNAKQEDQQGAQSQANENTDETEERGNADSEGDQRP